MLFVDSIDLKNLHIDNPIHELWKWCMLFLYKESTANYYWQNFKKEAFGNDKGEDFKKRLGTMKGVDLKKEEVDKSNKILLAYNEQVDNPALKPN